MSDVDVIIQVHTQGVQQIGNLSASLRNLSANLRGVTVPMSKLDSHTRAVNKALGITSRGVDQHAKKIKELAANQKILALEARRLQADLGALKNAYALAGRETTSLGKSIGVTTKELQAFSRTFRGMRLRALGSDFQNISLRMSKLGKDAQFVGRSLLINLTLPLATFARIGLSSFLGIEKQMVRITKVMEDLAPTMDIAAQKIVVLTDAMKAQGKTIEDISAKDLTSPAQLKQAERMVKNFKDMDTALTDMSLKFAVSKDVISSVAADFGELGLTASENVQKLTNLTLEIEKLGSMDIGPAQDLTQALYFQSRRALELNDQLKKVTTAREREQKAINASITQMYLFNAIENATALTLKDLGDSFAEVSAMATSYGLSMTEAAAMLAPMKAAGLDIGASANSIKVSLQRLLAPTKQNVETLKKLAKEYGVTENKQNEFLLSTKTGLTGLDAVVKVFDKVRDSKQGAEGALRLMSDLFEKRQGPRMYLAIEQLSNFNKELAKADTEFRGVGGSAVSAEVQIARVADKAGAKFENFNNTIVPKTIRSFRDIGIVARIATAVKDQKIEIEPGKEVKITEADIRNAKSMRQAVSDLVLAKKQSEGIDIISEVKDEAGRALMIQLAGAANAKQIAEMELTRSLKSANVATESIKNTFKLFASDIIRSLIPAIEKISKKVVEMYKKWNSPEFAKTRQTIIRIITTLGSFLAIMGPLILALGTFQSVVGKVGLGIARFFPKLKTADGAMTRLGESTKFAKKQMDALYETFLRTTGLRQAAAAGGAATGPIAGPPRPLMPGSKKGTFLTPARTADLASMGNVGQRTSAVQAARLAAAGIRDIDGGPTAVEQEKLFRDYLRRRPTATRLPPAHMAASMGLPATTPALQDAFDTYRTTSATKRADLTPARSRRAARRQLAAAAKFASRAEYYEAAGVGVMQEMGETGRVGRERFAFRGRDINQRQAQRLAFGGPGAALTRAQLTASAVGQRAMTPFRAGREAITAARTAAAGPSGGVLAGGKAMTSRILANTAGWKGASAALAAYNAQLAAFNMAPASGFKKYTIFLTNFIRNMKLATLATKIFKMSLMFTGVGAIILAISAAVFLVVKNMDKIKSSAKVIEPLKKAWGLIKEAVVEIIRPIQDLFAVFGSGADEGEASSNAIVKAFEGIAKAIEIVAGFIKMFVTKVIKPYLYGIVNVVMAVVELFKGNWKGALKFLIAAVSQVAIGMISIWQMLAKGMLTISFALVKGIVTLFFKGIVNGLIQAVLLAIRGVVNLLGKIPGLGSFTDPINNALKNVGSFVSDMTSKAANGINGVIGGVEKFAKKSVDVVGDGLKKGLGKGADLGIKESANKIKVDKKVPKAAKDQGDLAGEAIADAYGDAPIEDANDKIAGKIKEGIMDAVQKLQDYIAGRFASALKKFISDSVKALNKQKESALKVFDVQLNTLMKLEKAEESLTKKKEYETNRRKLIDDATLRGEVYRRNRALAIYEGRIDDARILDLEEQQANKESQQQISALDESRRKDLVKENLEALREAINNAKELAGKFFDESVEKFQEAAEHITRISPVLIEQYTEQLNQLQTLTTQTADTNNLEFGKMFEKFTTTIAERMPNAVDEFGNALGAFSTPLDELVNLAQTKYGLGSEDEATVLGVTRKMADSVIGITLGMLVDIGDTFSGADATAIIEKYGEITGGIAAESGQMKEDVLTNFTTLLEETKTAFLTPYQKALDEANPTTVFKNAIIDGNEEILNSFRNMVELNPDLMKKLAASLDPAIKKYIELKAAIDAAKDAAAGGGGGGGASDPLRTANERAFYAGLVGQDLSNAISRQQAQARQTTTGWQNYAKTISQPSNTVTNSFGQTIDLSKINWNPVGQTQPFGTLNYVSRESGGPIPIGSQLKSTPYGISGFLNAPEQQGIPAILHGGEFVINAGAVKRIGLGALAKLNDSRIPKFKKGGFVGPADRIERQVLAAAKTNVKVNPSIGTADQAERKVNAINKKVTAALNTSNVQARANQVGITQAVREIQPLENYLAAPKIERARQEIAKQEIARNQLSVAEKFAFSSVGNLKRAIERAEAPDTRSLKDKTFDFLKGAGTVGRMAGGSILDQVSKIGAQDGLLDTLFRFDKSSLDIIGGGVARTGKILKGVYDHVLSPVAESFNATFINPAINTGGRLIGKNPNLRQAGMVESAINIADVITTVGTGGLSKAVTTGGKVGLMATLKAISKGSVRTSEEMLATKLIKMGMEGKLPTLASQLMPSNFGIDAATFRPQAPIRDVRKVISQQLALPSGPRIAGELMPGSLTIPTPTPTLRVVDRIGGAIPLPRPTVTSPLPRGDISEYIFHGGPKAEQLVGGVLNPEFIRGGKIWEILKRQGLGEKIGRSRDMTSGQASVLAHSESSQNRRIVSVYKSILNVIENANKYGPNEYVPSHFRDDFGNFFSGTGDLGVAKTLIRHGGPNEYGYRWADQVAYARKLLEENSEIIKRVISGETHMTGVDVAYGSGLSAYEYGGIHLIRAPKSLNPNIGDLARRQAMVAAPHGERIFWGTHKPIFSVDASWAGRQASIDQYAELIHAMIRDADSRLSPAQLADFALSQKIYGNQISPSARSFILEEFNRTATHRFKNAEEIYKLLEMAPTKDAMLDIINTKGIRMHPRGFSQEEDRAFTELVEHLNKTVNEFSSTKPLDPKRARIDQHLNSTIHSGVDGLVLGVADKVGKITYGEALIQYRMKQFLQDIPDIYHSTIIDAVNGKAINRQALHGLPNVEDVLTKARGLNLDILGGNYATPILPIENIAQQTNAARSIVDNMVAQIDTSARGAFTPMEGPFGPRFFRSPSSGGGPPRTPMLDIVERLQGNVQKIFPPSVPGRAAMDLAVPPEVLDQINKNLYEQIISAKVARQADELSFHSSSVRGFYDQEIARFALAEREVAGKILGSTSENIDIPFFRNYILESLQNPANLPFVDGIGYRQSLLKIGRQSPYGMSVDMVASQMDSVLSDEAIKRIILQTKREIQQSITTLPEEYGVMRTYQILKGEIGEAIRWSDSPLTNAGGLPVSETGVLSGEMLDFSTFLSLFDNNPFSEPILDLFKVGYNKKVLQLPFNQPINRDYDIAINAIKQHEAIYNALADIIGMTVRDFSSFFTQNSILRPDLVPELLGSKQLWTAVREFSSGNTNITDDFIRRLPSFNMSSGQSVGLVDLLQETINRAKVLTVDSFYGYPLARSHVDRRGMEHFFEILTGKANMLDSQGVKFGPEYQDFNYTLPFRKVYIDPEYFGSGLGIFDGLPQMRSGASTNIFDFLADVVSAPIKNSVEYFEIFRHINKMYLKYRKGEYAMLPGVTMPPNQAVDDVLTDMTMWVNSRGEFPKSLIEVFDVFDEVHRRLIAEGLNPEQFLSSPAMSLDSLLPMIEVYRPYMAANNIAMLSSSSVSSFAQRFAARRGMGVFPVDTNAIKPLDQIFSAPTGLLDRSPLRDLATPSDLFLAKVYKMFLGEVSETMNAPISSVSGQMPIKLFQGGRGYSEGLQEGFPSMGGLFDALNPYDDRLKHMLSTSSGASRHLGFTNTILPAIAGVGAFAGTFFTNEDRALAGINIQQIPTIADRLEDQSQRFYSNLNQLKEFIAQGESINALDPYSAWAKPGAPGMIMAGMTSMKIGEIINSAQGHAVGKYQNMPPYLLQRAKVAGYNIQTVFTPEVQEAIMLSTLMSSPSDAGTGLAGLFNGRISVNTAVDRIANMWRSMSGTGGKFVGGGINPSGFDPARKDLTIKKILEQMMLSYPRFMKGGFVKGMTSTAIPAMLHGGEYVLNASTVQQLGLPYLNAMNQVRQSRFTAPNSRINTPTAPVTNNVSTVNIQVENFIGEEEWFNSMMKEYNVNVAPKNQKLAGLEQRKFTSYNGINQGL